MKKDGKPVWVKPKYTKVFQHKLPNGKKLLVKGGTQIVDRLWQFIRQYNRHRSARVGSPALRTRIRSAQWAYWMRGSDLWLKTGEMLGTVF